MNTSKAPQPTVQGILHALSEPTRMAIFASLMDQKGCNCSAFLQVDHKAIPKSTLSQHFKVLRESGLILSEKKGVEVINRINCDAFTPELRTMVEGIITAYTTRPEL